MLEFGYMGESKNNNYSAKDTMFVLMFIITIGAIIFAVYSSSGESDQRSPKSVDATETTTIKTFYTKDSANVRSCGSVSCEVISTYSKDTGIELPYTSVDSLPEWVKLTLSDGSTGYINKITLTDTSAVDSGNYGDKVYSSSKADLIKKWSKRVGFLTCYSQIGNDFVPIQTASVYIHRFISGGVRGMTNRHAVENAYGGVLSGCSLEIPGVYEDYSSQIIPHKTYDVAQIVLPESDFTNALDRSDKVCYKENVVAELGDEVLILGYPGIGSNSLTVTEGIISGVDYPYFTTSAKIDYGNSGGAAILVEGDCLLGIPTGSVVGEIESLGRILDLGVFGS